MTEGFNRWWLLPFGILTTSALLTLSVVVFQPSFINRSYAEVAQQVASEAAVDCSGAVANDYACYQRRYQDLVHNSGVAAAFADLKDEYQKNQFVSTNCHQLTHVIGRAAVDLYGDLSGTYAQGDTFCQAGYYHGAIEALAARIGSDKIVDEANTICADLAENERYSFYHYSCVHGLGHGFMGVLNNELYKSLETCDKLTDEWEREQCYDGVFMQNVMAAYDPSYPTKYLKADQPLYPCTDVQDKYKTQCYKRQIWYALYTQGNDFSKVFDLCGTVNDGYRTTCYEGLGRDASWRSEGNVAKTKDTCMLGGDYEARSSCVAGAVEGFSLYYDSDQGEAQAKVLCESLEADLRAVCLQKGKEYFEDLQT